MRRHTAGSPCAVCAGYESMPRGQGKRCAGFSSDDGLWVNCERGEWAGDLHIDERTTPSTYRHWLGGACHCNRQHTAAVAAQNGHARTPSRRIVAATYDYAAADGTLLYQTVRYQPKGFCQRRPDGRGDWIWQNALDGVTRVPYCLSKLLAAPTRTLFIVEGERDADRLTSLELLATTNAGGAEKWTDALSEHLRGRARVVVLPDNDAAGRRHGQGVARSVTAVALVPDVRVIELPGLPEGGDVSDWLDAGHDSEELKRLVTDAPRWKPQAPTDDQVLEAGDAAVLGELARHAHLRGTLDPNVAGAMRLVAKALGVSAERLADAVREALAAETSV
jgi:putative DNA primase/helicase